MGIHCDEEEMIGIKLQISAHVAAYLYRGHHYKITWTGLVILAHGQVIISTSILVCTY